MTIIVAIPASYIVPLLPSCSASFCLLYCEAHCLITSQVLASYRAVHSLGAYVGQKDTLASLSPWLGWSTDPDIFSIGFQVNNVSPFAQLHIRSRFFVNPCHYILLGLSGDSRTQCRPCCSVTKQKSTAGCHVEEDIGEVILLLYAYVALPLQPPYRLPCHIPCWLLHLLTLA